MAKRKTGTIGSRMVGVSTFDDLQRRNEHIVELYKSGANSKSVAEAVSAPIAHVLYVLRSRGLIVAQKARW